MELTLQKALSSLQLHCLTLVGLEPQSQGLGNKNQEQRNTFGTNS
jgi:hypothetical protein